jgi:hypothetical protein
MTRRRWLLAVLVVVLVAAVAGVVAWKVTHRGQLTYSVTALGQRRIEAKLSDSRSGKHTDWVVLLDGSQRGDRRLLNLFQDGSSSGWGGTSTRLRLPAGVYRYSVYSVGRLYAADNPAFWTSANQVAAGQVTVR